MGKTALTAAALLAVILTDSSARPQRTLPASGPQIRTEIRKAVPLGGTDTVSLMILGDVMVHARQLEHEFGAFLKHLAPAMRAADFTAANLEFSLGGEPYSGYPSFSAPDSIATVLAAQCGVDIFLTANNHILDRGTAGLERTLEVYAGLRDSLGTRYTGCAADSLDEAGNNPLMLLDKGVRIALVNFTYGTNHAKAPGWPEVSYMLKDEVAETMEAARNSGADFIVALPHWGTEYSLRHDSVQEDWAEWLVASGADAVVGSHPHVVQDTARIDGKPVIYSTGNAVSNMSAINTRLGMAVTLRFVHDLRSGEKKLLEPELTFTWCCLPGMLDDGYSTIIIKEWACRRDDWLTPSDFDNMVSTLGRVRAATGISGQLAGL